MKLPVPYLFIAVITLMFVVDSGAQSLLAEEVNSADAFFESMESNRQWPS